MWEATRTKLEEQHKGVKARIGGLGTGFICLLLSVIIRFQFQEVFSVSSCSSTLPALLKCREAGFAIGLIRG